MADPSIVRFRKVVAAACEAIDARRDEINDLNVFPVADGDTGDNMSRTLHAVLEELDLLAAHSNGETLDEIGREEIVKCVARAALLGARGNSGVILSQIVRGLAEELVSRPHELVDPMLIAAALARAVDAAYESVRDPAEGTMLTVVREMAHRTTQDVAHIDRPRLQHDATPDEQDELLARLLSGALAAGERSVDRSPDLLPILRESGVVDAGGYGIVVIVAGAIAALRREDATDTGVAHYSAPLHVVHHDEHIDSKYRYCTNFAVTGSGLTRRDFVEPLEQLGDSVLVVGDQSTLRVHLHTDVPDAAVTLLSGSGEVVDVQIADMHLQVAERTERLANQAVELSAVAGNGSGVVAPEPMIAATHSTGRCGVVAAVSGRGIGRMFQEFGATTVDGGETFNPSTSELLAAIEAAPEQEVVVLPNSRNVVMAAERAAEMSSKRAVVLDCASQQAGLAAVVAFDSDNDARTNASALRQMLAQVHTGGVAEAARDDAEGRFHRGDAVGFIDEEIVAWGEPAETLEAVLGSLGRDAELLTILAAVDPPLGNNEVHELAPLGPEIELHDGGQPNWWWLIAAE